MNFLFEYEIISDEKYIYQHSNSKKVNFLEVRWYRKLIQIDIPKVSFLPCFWVPRNSAAVWLRACEEDFIINCRILLFFPTLSFLPCCNATLNPIIGELLLLGDFAQLIEIKTFHLTISAPRKIWEVILEFILQYWSQLLEVLEIILSPRSVYALRFFHYK